MKARRLFALCASAFLLAPAFVIAAAQPALACSCIRLAEDKRLEMSDAVFTGNVTDIRARHDRNAVWTFAVDRVYKGTVAKRQEIRTRVNSPACGMGTSRPSGRMLVFASRAAFGGQPTSKQLSSSRCSGNRVVGATQPVPEEFGPGHSP